MTTSMAGRRMEREVMSVRVCHFNLNCASAIQNLVSPLRIYMRSRPRLRSVLHSSCLEPMSVVSENVVIPGLSTRELFRVTRPAICDRGRRHLSTQHIPKLKAL